MWVINDITLEDIASDFEEWCVKRSGEARILVGKLPKLSASGE